MSKECLIVDDSSVVRKICRRIVEDLGFTAYEAGDGKDALQKCRETMPDVILLDWNMPEMDGMQFLKEFRPHQLEHEIIIIFCTTENDITKIKEAMEAGADEYIMKPFDDEILKDKFVQMGLVANE